MIFVITYLYDVSSALAIQETQCQSSKHWADMLLPSTKGLWEARTQNEWEREYTKQNCDQRPTFRNLVQQQRNNAVEAENGDGNDLLDDWLGQTDGLGGILICTATLLIAGE